MVETWLRVVWNIYVRVTRDNLIPIGISNRRWNRHSCQDSHKAKDGGGCQRFKSFLSFYQPSQ